MNQIIRTKTFIMIGFWNFDFNEDIPDKHSCEEIFGGDSK
jgi:hypothetical protein